MVRKIAIFVFKFWNMEKILRVHSVNDYARMGPTGFVGCALKNVILYLSNWRIVPNNWRFNSPPRLLAVAKHHPPPGSVPCGGLFLLWQTSPDVAERCMYAVAACASGRLRARWCWSWAQASWCLRRARWRPLPVRWCWVCWGRRSRIWQTYITNQVNRIKKAKTGIKKQGIISLLF